MRPKVAKVTTQYMNGYLTVGDLIRSLVEIDALTDAPDTGFGTCEACGATCTGVLAAVDTDNVSHTFCGPCVDSGRAMVWMEEREG